MKKRILIFSLASLMVSQAFAEDEHASHEAHVHGEAEMTIILVGADLAIEFESPAANLVGFEHEPESDLQRNKLDGALLELQSPASWLLFDGGNCELKTSKADSTFGSDSQEHNSFHAEYFYQCGEPQSLEAVSVLLNSTYPGIEHIEVQWIINGQQGSSDLEEDQTRLTFE